MSSSGRWVPGRAPVKYDGTAVPNPQTSQLSHPASRLSGRVILAFACVYLFWGSTYVAIRFGVEVLSPWVLACVRFLIAGPLMLALCAAHGLRLRQASWRDLGLLAAIGVLMLGIGNMALVWCEQYLPSGLAALLIAVVPLFVALFEAVLPHGEGLRARGWIGIAVGFLGLLILVSPGLLESRHGKSAQLVGSAVAVLSAFAWSCGSILSRRARIQTSAFVAAGWEMLFAGVFNLGLLALSGQARNVRWTAQGGWSIAWLVVFGSLVGYTAYIYLLDNVPVAKVATYAYVNPIVAVVLGALFLRERMVPIEYAGMAAILVTVWLVTTSKLKSGMPAPEDELVEVEPS
jgi:drug/metabolite transporter (DMT)-like permease